MQVQQFGVFLQGFENGCKLLLHDAGRQIGHAVAEFVWVSRLRRHSGERHGCRSSRVSVSRIFASSEIEDWNENVVVSEIRCSVFYEARSDLFCGGFCGRTKAPATPVSCRSRRAKRGVIVVDFSFIQDPRPQNSHICLHFTSTKRSPLSSIYQ